MIGYNEPEYEIDLWADGKKSFDDNAKQMTLRPGETQGFIYKPLIQVIDLFCGGGGFTDGAIQAGADVVLAVDCWQPALDIHLANYPRVPVLKMELGGSIIETAILLRRRLTPGAHFHLHASPPCQAISNASSQTDPENGMVMVRWFLDLVAYMQPDSWSMENVLPVGKRLPLGTPYVTLNSANFGVPQTRKRVFAGEGWIAQESHVEEDWVSVLDALPHFSIFLMLDNETVVNTDGCSKSISRRALSVDRVIQEPAKTIHNNSPTLRTVDNPNPTKAVKIRSLTLQETAILQGFSSSMKIPYTLKKSAWTVIGNAVCPPVAEAVIRGITQ